MPPSAPASVTDRVVAEAIPDPAAAFVALDEPGLGEHLQMVRDGWL